jgi:hypothetical protein
MVFPVRQELRIEDDIKCLEGQEDLKVFKPSFLRLLVEAMKRLKDSG